MLPKFLRFADLRERGVVRNRPALNKLIKDRGFPKGQQLGPNTRVWTETEVTDWVKSRPTDLKPAHPLKPGKKRGRPRKTPPAATMEGVITPIASPR